MARNSVLLEFAKKGISLSVIIDVGANVGQSSTEFAMIYPCAHIHALEPVAAAFEALSVATSRFPNVACDRLALSCVGGQASVISIGNSPANRLATEGDKKYPQESVTLITGDDYCSEKRIDQIDFLKIDTEGHDLSVLLGFVLNLKARRIKFIQVECALSPENQRHVRFESFTGFLFPFGYSLFGLFDLMPLKRSGRLGAFYGNAVYVLDSQ